MRSLFFLALLCLLPVAVHAQLVVQNGKSLTDSAANSTALAPSATVDDGTGPVEAVIQGTNFPANAITSVGNGRNSAEPANVATQQKVLPSDSPLWPTDTVDIFVSACAANKHQLVPFCRCVIERTALKIPHNEFVMLSDAERIESDPRFLEARESCTPREQRAR